MAHATHCHILTVFSIWTYVDLGHAILFIRYCACYPESNFNHTNEKQKEREENFWLLEHQYPWIEWLHRWQNTKTISKWSNDYDYFQMKMVNSRCVRKDTDFIRLNWFVRVLLGTDNQKKKRNRYSKIIAVISFSTASSCGIEHLGLGCVCVCVCV